MTDGSDCCASPPPGGLLGRLKPGAQRPGAEGRSADTIGGADPPTMSQCSEDIEPRQSPWGRPFCAGASPPSPHGLCRPSFCPPGGQKVCVMGYAHCSRKPGLGGRSDTAASNPERSDRAPRGGRRIQSAEPIRRRCRSAAKTSSPDKARGVGPPGRRGEAPEKKVRRRRDSNPRDPFRSSGFQNRRNQPLCHPSMIHPS